MTAENKTAKEACETCPSRAQEIVTAAKLNETVEGILAGEIAALVVEGAMDARRIAPTLIRAVALIRGYGDRRVKDFQNAH